jgi:bifunctional non-homologous end joining protein LigD
MAVRRRTRQKAAPGFIPELDPEEAAAPPTGPGWVHEVKWDGFRAQAHLRNGKVTTYSRSGLDWTDEFDTVSEAVAKLPAKSAVLDGEVVVLGQQGKPDFQDLRRNLGKHSRDLQYFAFDLLELDGKDLRDRPLVERKAKLEKLLARAPDRIRYVEYFENNPKEVIAAACKHGLEGIVSKKADAPYAPGRRGTWVKSKCHLTDNFPIVAFVEKLGAKPRRIASFYVGRREKGKLLYGGKIQTGFTMVEAQEIREALDPFIQKESPLDEKIDKPKATWVRPVLDAEIAYNNKTDAGLVRHGSFKGLRDDLAKVDVPRPQAPGIQPAKEELEGAKGNRHAAPENMLQLLHGAVAPDLDTLEAYWRKVGPKALKYLGRRPLKLVRHVGSKVFYHKRKLPPIPDGVHALTIEKREGGEGVRVWVDHVDGLVALSRGLEAVELHPWNATVDDIEIADQIVLDLDPGEGIALPFVVETALRVRELMEGEGLKPWPKVTGGKGYHVMAALTERMSHDQARAYSKDLAMRIMGEDRRYTVSASMGQRPGHLFIDYLRNGRGSTAIGTWSPRARRGFPIARPVTWKQVEQAISPSAFSMSGPERPQSDRKPDGSRSWLKS